MYSGVNNQTQEVQCTAVQMQCSADKLSIVTGMFHNDRAARAAVWHPGNGRLRRHVVQCSVVQYIAVYYSAVQCSAVYCSAVYYSTVQWHAVAFMADLLHGC